MWLFRNSKIAEKAADDQADAYACRLWSPLTVASTQEARLAELPAYVARQEALAAELLDELNMRKEALVDLAELNRVWEHYLSNRRLVKRATALHRRPKPQNPLQLTHRFDIATLQLIEKMSALFGVALRQRLPNLRWQVGHFDSGNYIFEGQPILSGFPGEFSEMNPTQTILTIANRSMGSESRDVLGALFSTWVGWSEIAGDLDEEI